MITDEQLRRVGDDGGENGLRKDADHLRMQEGGAVAHDDHAEHEVDLFFRRIEQLIGFGQKGQLFQRGIERVGIAAALVVIGDERSC